MSVTIPYLFEAKQISVMSVTPQTVSTGGLLVPGTAYDLADLGVYDRFNFDGDRNLFEYSPANAQIEAYQPGKITFTASISQFDRPGKASVLTDIYQAFSHLRIAAQAVDPFSAVAGKTFVIIAAVGTISTGWVEQKNATILSLRPCGILPQFLASPTI